MSDSTRGGKERLLLPACMRTLALSTTPTHIVHYTPVRCAQSIFLSRNISMANPSADFACARVRLRGVLSVLHVVCVLSVKAVTSNRLKQHEKDARNDACICAHYTGLQVIAYCITSCAEFIRME